MKNAIVEYLYVLKKGNNPLYAWEAQFVKDLLEAAEDKLDDDVIDDLRYLSDKDLIIKYDLEPKTVSTKYCSIDIEDIKPSLKYLDIENMKDNFYEQYKRFAEWGWL